MEKIIELLLEKEFFNKDIYEKYGVLTSEQIQKVWLEATVRRKIDFSKLPYLLEVRPGNGKQKGGTNKKDADIFKADAEVNPENEDISGQTKPNQTKINYLLRRKKQVMLRLKFRGMLTIRLHTT